MLGDLRAESLHGPSLGCAKQGELIVLIGSGFVSATGMNRSGCTALPTGRLVHEPSPRSGLSPVLLARGCSVPRIVPLAPFHGASPRSGFSPWSFERRCVNEINRRVIADLYGGPAMAQQREAP